MKTKQEILDTPFIIMGSMRGVLYAAMSPQIKFNFRSRHYSDIWAKKSGKVLRVVRSGDHPLSKEELAALHADLTNIFAGREGLSLPEMAVELAALNGKFSVSLSDREPPYEAIYELMNSKNDLLFEKLYPDIADMPKFPLRGKSRWERWGSMCDMASKLSGYKHHEVFFHRWDWTDTGMPVFVAEQTLPEMTPEQALARMRDNGCLDILFGNWGERLKYVAMPQKFSGDHNRLLTFFSIEFT